MSLEEKAKTCLQWANELLELQEDFFDFPCYSKEESDELDKAEKDLLIRLEDAQKEIERIKSMVQMWYDDYGKLDSLYRQKEDLEQRLERIRQILKEDDEIRVLSGSESEKIILRLNLLIRLKKEVEQEDEK